MREEYRGLSFEEFDDDLKEIMQAQVNIVLYYGKENLDQLTEYNLKESIKTICNYIKEGYCLIDPTALFDIIVSAGGEDK
jgi:hypothetical protein